MLQVYSPDATRWMLACVKDTWSLGWIKLHWPQAWMYDSVLHVREDKNCPFLVYLSTAFAAFSLCASPTFAKMVGVFPSIVLIYPSDIVPGTTTYHSQYLPRRQVVSQRLFIRLAILSKVCVAVFSRNSVLPNHEARSHCLPANSTFCVVSLRNQAFSPANPNQPFKASIDTIIFLFQESV